MNTQIAASPEAMLELSNNIQKDLREIVVCNEGLSEKLENLGSTFNDEGFDIIRGHIEATKNRITEAIPEFQIFIGKLIEKANLYKQSNAALDGTDGIGWAGKAIAIPAVLTGLSAGAVVPEPIVRTVKTGPVVVQTIVQRPVTVPADEQYKKQEAVYETCYPQIRNFAFQTGISVEQQAVLREFWLAFDYIIDNELKPFYAELSPPFWKWLKETLAGQGHKQ